MRKTWYLCVATDTNWTTIGIYKKHLIPKEGKYVWIPINGQPKFYGILNVNKVSKMVKVKPCNPGTLQYE